MTERIIFRLDSAPDAPDKLDAQEAFAQLRDLFQLAIASTPPGEKIYWRLVSVSMNSPLTVVAEAAAVDEARIFDVDRIARATKVAFATNVGELIEGRMPASWEAAPELERIAREVLSRASATEIPEARVTLVLDDPNKEIPPPILDRRIAANALALLATATEPTPTPTKKQYGSVEGVTVAITTHYRKPAIRIKERTRGHELTCVVTEEHRAEFARSGSFDDVWKGRRVIVSGLLSYDVTGKPCHVIAEKIRWLESKAVEVSRIRDPGFTAGLSVADYLDRFREGSLG